jgi:hypothetical protein
MLVIKPSRLKIFILFIVFTILFLFFSFNESGTLSEINFVFILGIVFSLASLFLFRVSLDSSTLTYVGFLGRKIISIRDIGSLALRPGGRRSEPTNLILHGKNNTDELLSLPILGGIFRKNDAKKIINELMRLNPEITMSAQVKNFIEGKLYYVTSFKDS